MHSSKHSKRIISIFSIFLSLIITLTSINLQPLTVHALEGDNGHLTTIHGTVKSYPLGFVDIHQGYRFYVIDNQHNLVSKVVDFVYSTPNVAPSHWYTNPRWAPLSTDDSNYDCYSINELMTKFCAGADTPNYDITSSDMYPVHIEDQTYVGAKFQLWFLGTLGRGDIGTSSGDSSGSSSSTGNTTNNPPIIEEDPLEPSEGPIPYERIESGRQLYNSGAFAGSYNYDELIDYYNIDYIKDITITDDMKPSDIQREEQLALQSYQDAKKEAKEKLNADALRITKEYKGSYECIVKAYARLYSEMSLYECKSAALYSISQRINNAVDNSNIRSAVYFNLYTLCSLDESDIYGYRNTKTASNTTIKSDITNNYTAFNSNMLSNQIPLAESDNFSNISESTYSGTNGLAELESAGIDIEKLSELLDIQVPLAEAEKTDLNYPADRFVSNEQSPFNVKGFNMDITGNGSVTLLDAIDYEENGKNKYGLVVEPLFWAGMYASSNTYQNWYTYGTYYNILQYYLSQGWDGSGCHVSYLKAHGKNCMVVAESIPEFSLTPATDGSRLPLQTIMDAINAGVGYGMHFYFRGNMKKKTGTTSETHTYNSSLGTTIGQAPDPTSLAEETDLGNLSKSVTIIKNYVTLDTSTNTETVDGNYTRIQNPHTIEIQDEPNYKVALWETSTEQTAPLTESDNGDKTKSYSSLIQNSSHTQSETANGFTTGTVTLDKTEYILYVKLVRTTNPPPPNVTGEFILRQSEITRAVSTNSNEPGTKKIEVKLKFSIPDINVSCSGHSHNHERTGYNDSNNNGQQDNGESDTYATGNHTHSGASMNHNSTYELAVKNDEESNYTNIIVQSDKANFKSIIPVMNLRRSSADAVTDKETSNYTYYFTLYRHDNGEQNLNLAEYNQKQSSNSDIAVRTTKVISDTYSTIVGDLGYTKASSKTTKNRASIGYTADAVKFKFIYDSSNSPVKNITNKFPDISCSYGNITGESNSGDVTVTHEPEAESTIAVQVYSGTANRPLNTTVTTPETGTHNEKYITRRKVGLTSKPTLSNSTNPTGNNNTGLMVTTGIILKFNPFIKMTFSKPSDLKNGNIIKYPVNVLSEYQRELQPNDFAEVDWDYAGDSVNLIDLKSQMWATDEHLTNNTESWKQPNSVLKGGSSYQLSISDSNMREVTLRTYQAVVPSTDTFVENGADLTVAKATTAHTNYINSAVDSFEKLHIVQRVTTEIKTSGTLAEQSINCDKVERGGDISFLHNGSNGIASTDEKYYLNKDLSGLNSGASEGDLDVKQLPTTTLYYKVWSDTLGNILIASDSNLDTLANRLDGTVVLTKSQGIADLTNQTAIALNDRTLVIEKLLNAVERNTGNDTSCDWALDGKWYNESFATYIMINETPLKLGLKSPSSRGAVIDAKLCPYIKDKNSQGTTAFTSQFTLDSFSEKWGSSNPGKIAEFKTQSVYIKDMNKLLTSKLFYIPNQTVQNSR